MSNTRRVGANLGAIGYYLVVAAILAYQHREAIRAWDHERRERREAERVRRETIARRFGFFRAIWRADGSHDALGLAETMTDGS